MTTLSEISAKLAEPFAVEDIDLLPKGKIERDGKTLCMALAYADPRVYQDRLNTLAPGEWETPPPIALNVGDKLICYVTVVICGVRHTDAGEAGPGENQGTEAFSQAFKRACSQFGLGRYLYGLDKQWVPYDPRRKQIDLDAAGIQNVVRKMYAQARIPMAPQQRQAQNVESTTTRQDANTSKSHHNANLSDLPNGDKIPRQNGGVASVDSGASEQGHSVAGINDRQITAIRNLCSRLEKAEPEGLAEMGFEDAGKLIKQLTTESQMKVQPAYTPANAHENALLRLAISKGVLPSGATAKQWYGRCSEILQITVSAAAHLTPSRMEKLEQYLKSAEVAKAS